MIEKSILKLSEVAELFDVNESKIRYYVTHFNINVPKKANKLAFSKKHVEKIREVIQLTNNKGFKLDGAKKNMKIKEEKTEHLAQVLEHLTNLKTMLTTLHSSI